MQAHTHAAVRIHACNAKYRPGTGKQQDVRSNALPCDSDASAKCGTRLHLPQEHLAQLAPCARTRDAAAVLCLCGAYVRVCAGGGVQCVCMGACGRASISRFAYPAYATHLSIVYALPYTTVLILFHTLPCSFSSTHSRALAHPKIPQLSSIPRPMYMYIEQRKQEEKDRVRAAHARTRRA